MWKSIGNSINKNLMGKYSQKLPDYAKQYATNALKIEGNGSLWQYCRWDEPALNNGNIAEFNGVNNNLFVFILNRK